MIRQNEVLKSFKNAVYDGDPVRVEEALKQGAPTDTMEASGSFPLNTSVQKNDLTMVKLLLRYHANTETRSLGGYTPLAQATLYNSKDLFEELIKFNADPFTENWNMRRLKDLARDACMIKMVRQAQAAFRESAGTQIVFNKTCKSPTVFIDKTKNIQNLEISYVKSRLPTCGFFGGGKVRVIAKFYPQQVDVIRTFSKSKDKIYLKIPAGANLMRLDFERVCKNTVFRETDLQNRMYSLNLLAAGLSPS